MRSSAFGPDMDMDLKLFTLIATVFLASAASVEPIERFETTRTINTTCAYAWGRA